MGNNPERPMRGSILALAAHLATALATLALAPAGRAAEAQDGPVVLELFTSQSCSSCPPAEALLAELARGRPAVIALELHVDYWDRLVHGGGAWKDPFSDPAFTARQRRYAQTVRDGGSIYTPQMIVDGREGAVGSARRDVEAAIRRAHGRAGHLAVTATADAAGLLRVAIAGTPGDAAGLWLARIEPARTTAVPRGENAGRTLPNHNIVRALTRVGDVRGPHTLLEVTPALAPGEECVVFVQVEGQGAILGAARCPAPA